MSKNSDLIDAVVHYAVQNMNGAVEILNEQLDDFDSDDHFYKEVNLHSSPELDNFVLDMATSDVYIEDTIDILIKKGYNLVKVDDQQQTIPVSVLVESLVNSIGKNDAIKMIVDM